MTNNIKENILIFWGSLAICLYVADSFGWIDLCQWLKDIIFYEYTYEETTRIVFPVLFTTLALIGIIKIIIISFQMGHASIPSLPSNGRHEVKLLPALPFEEVSCAESPTEDNRNMKVSLPGDRMQRIRDRHLHEQIALRQQVIDGIHDYLFNILPPYMNDKDIDTLYKNVELWLYSQSTPPSPTLTNGKLTTLDLRHLAWNIGERLKWSGEQRAIFIKQSFPNEFRDSDISSIRRNLRQQGDCLIKIDIPDKHDFKFHQFET